MLDLSIAAEERHQRFIKRVVEFGIVWGLSFEDEWVTSTSTSDEFEGATVLPFWSDRAYAQQCAQEEWSSYIPAIIPLSEFIENWCVGMHNQDEIVGTNWNAHLTGKESEPLMLALELLRAIKLTGTPISFNKYSSLEELLSLVEGNTDK